MEKAIFAMIASAVVGVFVYPKFIEFLESKGSKQEVNEFAPDAFKEKKKTVTFGGAVFVAVPIIVMVILNGFTLNRDLFLLIMVYGSYALIGFVDDYKIVTEGKNDGISAKTKMAAQLGLSVVFYAVYILTGGDNMLSIPFLKTPINLGIFYLPLVMFMLSGASNAVNLTDGMDGLAGGTSLIAFIPFAYYAYKVGNFGVLLFILAIIGGLIAFLFFNRKPARIFMGDVGSLALGAALAAVAIVLGKEVILVVVAGVFVFETLCVIIQKISWKLRKKRIFRFTPIHYSFTLNGWDEADVVNMFYGIGLVCMVIGFVLLSLS
ncbi:phospho-N-acetylmuramoyl-pentapeptide-transferase [Erysipelothrix sp. HDW6C]|uniref:phospho-N-acetylmuramoyl-pentapeptide- transferase n=1 Tax=Erysipelothrix sp. HDW6C TaxID=2714930 RepID=UPI001407C309|nr:phospho-N-acetylmuramoyl-pentapeptide-transferase [Erysipelothrix sp. HDW6C]QIK70372.1 phospho-N-acetylmuramoyl-pentapeptide-transferase [Erysipelothrix sp. HDW6C]